MEVNTFILIWIIDTYVMEFYFEPPKPPKYVQFLAENILWYYTESYCAGLRFAICSKLVRK